MYTEPTTLGGLFDSKNTKARKKNKKRIKKLQAQSAGTADPVAKARLEALISLLWRTRNLSKKDRETAERSFNSGAVEASLLRKADYKTARKKKDKKKYGKGWKGKLLRFHVSTRKIRHSKLAKFSPDWKYKYNYRDKDIARYRQIRRELPYIKDPAARAAMKTRYYKYKKSAGKHQKRAAIMDAIGTTVTTWGIGTAIGGLGKAAGKIGKAGGSAARFVVSQASDKAIKDMVAKGMRAEEAGKMARLLEDYPPDPRITDPAQMAQDSMDKKMRADDRKEVVKKALPWAAGAAVLLFT